MSRFDDKNLDFITILSSEKVKESDGKEDGMVITEEIYEAAWAKRDIVTADFKAQLEKDMEAARALPLGQQTKAAIAAADRYDDACEPAVIEWRRDLGIIDD